MFSYTCKLHINFYVRIPTYTGDRAVFQRCTSRRESSLMTLSPPLRLSSENLSKALIGTIDEHKKLVVKKDLLSALHIQNKHNISISDCTFSRL